MNYRTSRIATLLVVLLSLAGRHEAAAQTVCSTSTFQISAPCSITSSGSYTVTASFSGSSNQGSVCNLAGGSGTGICLACTGTNGASCGTGSGPLVSNVTIDLGGHTITAGSSAYDAICGFANAGVTIRNGIIDGNTQVFNVGVAATGANARVERLQVRNSGYGSGTAGIFLGDAAVAVDNVVTHNQSDNGSTDMIICGIDCVIAGNVANASGSATGTTGIATGNGGLVEENTVMGNATGLSLGTSTGYGENVLMSTTTNVSGGTNMGKNICNGSTSC